MKPFRGLFLDTPDYYLPHYLEHLKSLLPVLSAKLRLIFTQSPSSVPSFLSAAWCFQRFRIFQLPGASKDFGSSSCLVLLKILGLAASSASRDSRTFQQYQRLLQSTTLTFSFIILQHFPDGVSIRGHQTNLLSIMIRPVVI